MKERMTLDRGSSNSDTEQPRVEENPKVKPRVELTGPLRFDPEVPNPLNFQD